ncbi:MAG: S1C family serine protease [Cytophagaceae bacterium]
MTDTEKYEQIEKYLKGFMDSGEKISFEEKMKADPQFALEVQEHQKITDGLQSMGKRSTLKNKLDSIHAEMELKKLKKPASGIRRFLNVDSPVFAVAASLALLLAITAFLLTDHVSNKQTSNYQELSSKVIDLEQDQKSLKIQLKEKKKSPEVLPEKFRGTAFAISQDGYLITSYHIIKGARSIYIENGKSRFKADLVYADKDMAVLKINDSTFSSFKGLPYSVKPKSTELGENVFTLGYPREDIVYGEGSVSASTGYEGDTISFQVSVPVNPGNSGGPLFDSEGNVIGLIMAKHSQSDATAFALRSSYIMQALKKATDEKPIAVNKKNSIRYLKRSEQLKKIRDYVFVVKAYN